MPDDITQRLFTLVEQGFNDNQKILGNLSDRVKAMEMTLVTKSELSEIKSTVQTHTQILGEDETLGMQGDVKGIKKFQSKTVLYAALIQGFSLGLGIWIGKTF